MTIFDDGVCGFEPGRVDVELASPRLLGMTHWERGAAGSAHEIATEVDSERFFERYFSVFA